MKKQLKIFAQEQLRKQDEEYFKFHLHRKVLAKSPEPEDLLMPHQISFLNYQGYV